MPFNLLLLPLLGGFLFLHYTHVTRFQAQKIDGYRLLVESAFWGMWALIFARIIVVVASNFVWSSKIHAFWSKIVPIEDSDTAFLSMLIGAMSPLIVNLFINIETARSREIRRLGNALTVLLNPSRD